MCEEKNLSRVPTEWQSMHLSYSGMRQWARWSLSENFHTQVLKSNTQQYSTDLLLRRNLARLITAVRHDRVDQGLT